MRAKAHYLILTQAAINVYALEFVAHQLVLPASAWCVDNPDGKVYNCPLTSICTSDYAFCPYVSDLCPSHSPFKCANNVCTESPSSGCCEEDSFWCPHTNQCVTTREACCTLNPLTPIFCKATQTCVSFEYECCSNFRSYVTENTMVKCSHENKCVPLDSVEFCFTPFDQACKGDNAYQCPHDGKCVSSPSLCAATKVCPTGYFTCPDYTCLPGLAQFPLCKSLATCKSQTNLFARCSDGVTCTDDLQQCPTQVTCTNGLVLCPDHTCVKSQNQCLQVPSLTQQPKLGSCGPGFVRCADGQCAISCSSKNSPDCLSLGKAQCPQTFECVDSYDACSTSVFCPLPSNITHSLKSVICEQGPALCTWSLDRCKKSSCDSPINFFELQAKPWTAYNPSLLRTCSDGRCSQYRCSTQVSCSTFYPIKSQILGYSCTKTQKDAEELTELAYRLQAFFCPSNYVQCLSGHCRKSVHDCPQEITCPSERPVLCQDGSCVSKKDGCQVADIMANGQAVNCAAQGLILCLSDLVSCVVSVEQCPTMSTCPFGFAKCAENKCALDWDCSDAGQACNSLNPIFCRATDQCVSSLEECPKMTVCPTHKPVKCASDQSCRESLTLCPTVSSEHFAITVQTERVDSDLHCSIANTFKCQDGSCKPECPEWLSCADQYKCFDGRCVRDSSLCPYLNNGCPYNLPHFCEFAGYCVEDASECPARAQAYFSLNATCATSFGKQFVGCPRGNCAPISISQTVEQACSVYLNYVAECADYRYPNDQMILTSKCYSFQCPQALPFKCQNGLCVADKAYCPTAHYQASEINECLSQSLETGIDLRYPCADGTCASSADGCLPLYKCSHNANGLTYRCNDGTCKSDKFLCAPQKSQPNCPFRCQTGQCVNSWHDCLQENGCPASKSHRCSQNGGICVRNPDECISTSFVLDGMSLMPARLSDSICESRGLFTCVTDSFTYCATSESACYAITTGCPVTAPVLCGGACVKSITDCAPIIEPFMNHQGCTSQKPFRCSRYDVNSCYELPFATDLSLSAKTCAATTPSLVGQYPINRCSSPLTPYSCADGSCVATTDSCRSCPFFCRQSMSCAASSSECLQFGVLKSQSLAQKYQQICPNGAPIKCVLTGHCAQDSFECADQLPNSFQNTFTSDMFDLTCPQDKPIRCISGLCTKSSSDCFAGIKMDAAQMTDPLPWGSVSAKACSVYCADGSCRDTQENCPLARACLDPKKPYRCMNGACAIDQSDCIETYGIEETDLRDAEYSAYCTGRFGSRYGLDFVKCSDGTCRPAKADGSNSCLEFLGCPLTAAYQCPTGQCVQEKSDCLTQTNKHICTGSHKYMCKNMECVTDPSLCNINLSSAHVLQLQIDLNPFEQIAVSLAYNRSQSVIDLVLPAGSLPLDYSQKVVFQQDLYQKVRVNPVPQQYSFTTEICEDAFDYVNERYTLHSSRQLGGYSALLSPIIELSSTFQEQLAIPGEIRFKLDLPSCMDLLSDVCLAIVVQSSLKCVSRDITLGDNKMVSVPLTRTNGRYALIFNPDMSLKSVITPLVPTPNDDTVQDECQSFVCRYKWWIVGCTVGGFLLLAIILALCIKSRQQIKAEASQRVNSQVVQYETLYTEAQVEERIETEKEEALRLVVADFTQILKQKEERITQLEESVKQLSLHSPISRVSLYQLPEFNHELRLQTERIKQHYSSEVQRVVAKLQKDVKMASPRHSDHEEPPVVYNKQQYETQKYFQRTQTERVVGHARDTSLDIQWDKLVQEYRPPKELLSSTSRQESQYYSSRKK